RRQATRARLPSTAVSPAASSASTCRASTCGAPCQSPPCPSTTGRRSSPDCKRPARATRSRSSSGCAPRPARPPARTGRRGTELALLAFGVVLIVVAYANVGLARNNRIPSSTLGYGVGLGALFVIAHFAVRRFAPYADPILLP